MKHFGISSVASAAARKYSKTGFPYKIVAAALLLSASPAFGWGLDMTPDTTRYLSDPSFLPKRFQIYSETTYDYSSRSGDWQFNPGTTNEQISEHTNYAAQDFAFGITDYLSIHASGSYSSSSTHYTFTNRPALSVDNNDFNNPNFGLTFRAIDQARSPVSVDLSVNYAPAVAGTNPQAANAVLFVSREMRSLTIQAEAGLTYYDSHTLVDPLNGATQTDDSYWAYMIGVRTQLRLTKRFAINSGIAYSKVADTTVTTSAVPLSVVPVPAQHYAYDHDGTIAPYIALTFDVIPNRINLAVEYDHDFIGDEHRSGSAGGQWINQDEDLYAVHLRLLY